MSTSYPTKVLLAFRSGDRCAFPGCPNYLTVDAPDGGDAVVVGEAAHIAGENLTAARYIAEMTEEARNHYDNLIYMCGGHHTQIDKQEAHFTVDYLHRLKRNHEAQVREAMNSAFANVGFPEIAKATEWVCRFKSNFTTQDLAILPPNDKINKNGLNAENRLTITMGLSVARLVGEFIQYEEQMDSDFSERLTAGFLAEYHRLRHDGNRGSELFDLMCEFAQRGLRGAAKRSAGIAVLVYLFEKCEVFEK